MSTMTRDRATTQPRPLSVTPGRSSLLQRRCACGGTPGLDGVCAACRARRLAREQAIAMRQGPPTSATGHDFARIPIHPTGSDTIRRQVAAQAPPAAPTTPTVAPSSAPTGGSTVDCNASDISEISRARPIATAMVRKAVASISGPSNSTVDSLLRKYFNDDGPSTKLNTLIGYRSLLAGITTSYTIECEKPGSFMYAWFCGGVYAYVRVLPWANVHLCAGAFGRSDNELAETLVHEASHKFTNTDDEAYCWGGCPASLKPWNAYDNADSYSKFAYDAYTTLP